MRSVIVIRQLGIPVHGGDRAVIDPDVGKDRRTSLVLKVVQPGLTGLTGGSVSTLAPIFATVFASHSSHAAFVVGAASAVGAGSRWASPRVSPTTACSPAGGIR